MFNFSENEYRWCSQCSANVRRDAYYCKFCHKTIGSKILQSKIAVNVSGFITDMASWLGHFDEVHDALPIEFRTRIDKADQDSNPTYGGLTNSLSPLEYRDQSRNCTICPPNPPSAAIVALMWDILISLHEHNAPMNYLYADPRLQVLEITPGEVSAEHELRKEEISGNNKCKHCAEFVLQNDEVCRFCGGTSDVPPKPTSWPLGEYDRFDPTLLKNILIWESAKRRIDQAPPLDPTYLEKYHISDQSIELEILEQRKDPNRLPCSRFRKKMLELEITPGYFEPLSEMDMDYFMLDDVISLGRALTPNSFHQYEYQDAHLALIVYHHAEERWKINHAFPQHKHMLLNGKSTVYLDLKDMEKYKQLKKEADQVLQESIPEHLRDLSRSTLEDPPPLSFPIESTDPDERLKALEAFEETVREQQNERLKRINELIPGLADALSGINSISLNMTQVSKHTLKGQSYLKHSDYESACREFENAIDLLGNEVHDISRRSEISLQLADAQYAAGNAKLAEETFQRALVDATDVLEADADASALGHAHHKYACFLRDEGNYDQSEIHFKKAFQYHEESQEHLVEKHWLKEEQKRPSWRMKEDYASLLRMMSSREEQATLVANEGKALRELDEKETEERMQRKLRSQSID